MDSQQSKVKSYPLRLGNNLREMAQDAAKRDGMSLNRFIEMAVAEKLIRLQSGGVRESS